MQVGFDAKRAFCNFTGLGNYSRTLLKNLGKYHPEISQTLYTPEIKLDFTTKIPNSKVVKPFIPMPGPLSTMWRSFHLAQLINDSSLDIFHGLSHEIPFQKSSKVKRVVTIHDLIFIKYPELFSAIDRRIYLKKFKYACENADCIIAVSENTKKDIIKYFHIPEEKIKVVYQTCDNIFFKKYSGEELEIVSERYSLPEKFVLNIGSMIPRKNALSIVKAMHIIKEKIDHKLVLVGNGRKYKDEIKKYIVKNKLEDKVLFREIDFQDNPLVYQLADLFIYPSIYEGFGIPIIESLFSNTPVIAAKGSCLEEAGGPHGHYIDPFNSKELSNIMLKFLTDNQFRLDNLNQCQDHLKNFHPEKVTNDLVQVYQSLIPV